MGSQQVTAVEWSCNKPACNKQHTVAPNAEPPGIVLNVRVMEVGETHHVPGTREVYACSRTHVGPAVLAVYDAAGNGVGPDKQEGDDPADGGADGSDEREPTDGGHWREP